MKNFTNAELNMYEHLSSLTQKSMKKVLIHFLQKHYSRVIYTKDYIFAEGDIPIALVAHMDTVFKQPPRNIFFDARYNILISPQGLGADDRAGIFAILKIIQNGFRPHVIFTADEERGSIGASKLALLDCPFEDCRYIIELDRQGSNDCVFYGCDNEEFVKYVEQFGFTQNFGTYSDICEICPAWKIAGVNLSIGYYDEHSYQEVLYINQMLSTIKKVENMLKQATTAPYFEYIPFIDYKTQWYFNVSGPETIKCSKCKKYYMAEEVFPAIGYDSEETKFYCGDCLSETVAWCTECGSAFEKHSVDAPSIGICPLCIKLKEKKKNANR